MRTTASNWYNCTRLLPTSTTSHANKNDNVAHTTVQTNKDPPSVKSMLDTPRLTKAIQWIFSDSRTTGRFLLKGTPLVNKQPVKFPIKIALHNRKKTIKSTHTCNLNIPWLPGTMVEAHIVPRLAHLSFISTQHVLHHWMPSSIWPRWMSRLLQKLTGLHGRMQPNHWAMAATHQLTNPPQPHTSVRCDNNS